MNPIDMLIGMPGPTFLIVFAGLAVLCIAWAFLWPPRGKLPAAPLPPPELLNPIEIGYLQGGTQAVLQAVCFDCWARGELELTSAKRSDQKFRSRAQNIGHRDAIEAAVLNATEEECSPRNLLKDSRLRNDLEECLRPVREKLLQLRLLRSDDERRRASLRFWLALVIMAAVGVGKLYLGITRDKPVTYLIYLLVFTYAAWRWAYTKRASAGPTDLGRRYLESLKDYYEPLRVEAGASKLPEGTAYSLLPVVFGWSYLGTIAAFAPFGEALPSTTHGWAIGVEGGFGGDGGDGGGSDGGGGCGGCGGCGGG